MEDDEETLTRYGTPLPTYEQDEIPSKKPITVEDQIVLDINGKRRFHGAFTGGFSAGYWNTVGSEEGWTPQEFKSSRTERAGSSRTQKPMDFMDDEDLGEFGIAPQRVQTKDDFAAQNRPANATKRRPERSSLFASGPIPGQPVLRALLEPAREKTAVRILKRMGWREGQGIGERQTRSEKRKANARNDKELYVMKMYGCAMPGKSTEAAPVESDDGSDSASEHSDYEVTFAPDDFDPLVAAVKDNAFGLGYSGLDRGPAGRFNLFDTLEVVDRNNKKLSIRGQAFGIGALEDDDDLDVYSRDDMSRYDFSLEDKKPKKLSAIKSGKESEGSLEGFCPAQNARKLMKTVFRITMPDTFVPRNWEQRRSRFEPLDERRVQKLQKDNEYKVRGLGRHDLDPQTRGQMLGEASVKIETPTPNEPITVNPPNAILESISSRSNNFVTGEVLNGDTPVPPTKEPAEIKPVNQQYLGSTEDGFKPFIMDPGKQERYEKFLSFQPSDRYLTREQFLESHQPLNLSAWERERELKEFMQAERMYRPLAGLMSERFVTASDLIAEKTIAADDSKPREVKMKRSRTMWKPHKELCKRFNVPEPFGGMMADMGDEEKRKSKAKFSVFDYLEAPVNNRRNFVTPVVIPQRKLETDSEISTASAPVAPVTGKANVGGRVTAKDLFAAETDVCPPKVEEQKPKVAPPPMRRPEKRSELEQKVLEAVNKKPEEKQDLFRSIFCSSDEEEDNARDVPAQDRTRGPAPLSMTEEEKLKMVESFVAIKPASQLNILRNNSPPRGIFKSLLEPKRKPAAEEKPGGCAEGTEDSSSSTNDESDASNSCVKDSCGSEYYGPELPTTAKGNRAKDAAGADASGSKEELDERLRQLLARNAGKQFKEVWIEKKKSGDKNKKKKKHKDHKSKSKKHKKEKKKSKHKEKR